MDRNNNIPSQTPFADATNTRNSDHQDGPLHEELVATLGNSDVKLMSVQISYVLTQAKFDDV
jgi:hypothetical protein